jgi:hypothetical protein
MTHGGPKRLQFAPNNGKTWTCDEQVQVLEWTGQAYDLALKLGRSEQAVQTEKGRLLAAGITEPGMVRGPRCAPGPAVAWGSGSLCPLCHLALPVSGVCDFCG